MTRRMPPTLDCRIRRATMLVAGLVIAFNAHAEPWRACHLGRTATVKHCQSADHKRAKATFTLTGETEMTRSAAAKFLQCFHTGPQGVAHDSV